MRAAFEHIKGLVASVRNVPGAFIEVGVWRGDTFLPMARSVMAQGRLCHAVDSFQGMAKPTERDVEPDGKCRYPVGSLAADVETFSTLVADCPGVVIHEGWVPDILNACDEPAGFAFAHLDLDHYAPTAAALPWLWRRMNPGGILCCHDWWPDRAFLASGAINDWIKATGTEPNGWLLESHHVWFVK